MKIIIPAKKFAWSLRSSKFPLAFYTNKGEVWRMVEASKNTKVINAPDNIKYLVHYYESNRGNRYVGIYEVPTLKLIREISEKHLGSYPEFLEPFRGSRMMRDIEEWLGGTFNY